MMRQTERTTYRVGGRNGYSAIDEYRGDSCQRNIDCFKTSKQAHMTAGHLASAYAEGWRDAVGQWASDDHILRDLPAAYLECPEHHCGVDSDTPNEAHESHLEHSCNTCLYVADFIRARIKMRELALILHLAEQAHEDEKHGTGNSFKSGATRPKRL